MDEHLRHADINDLTCLMRVDLKSFPVAWEPETWKQAVSAWRESCVCITHKGTPVGFAAFVRDGSQLKIVRMAVLPNHRRKGYGTRLITWLEEYAADRKLGRLSCLVSETNIDACKFLSKNKFKVPVKGGIVKDAFSDYGETFQGYYFLRDIRQDI